MATIRKFESEADLAEVVRRRAVGLGWTAYAEVQVAQGDKRADLVFELGRRVMVVETKLSLTFDVVSQALLWLGRAHYVVVAVPSQKNSSSDRHAFIAEFLRSKGIGLWIVTPGEVWESSTGHTYENSHVQVAAKEQLHRWADFKAQLLRAVLTEEMKTACAGAKVGGIASTPFKRTCVALRKVVERSPGMSFENAMTSANHHYGSIRSARSSIEIIVKQAGLVVRDGRLFLPGQEDAAAVVPERPKPAVPDRKEYRDMVQISCTVCRGTLGLFKYEGPGVDYLRALTPMLDQKQAELAWFKASNLPSFQPCGCNGRQRNLI